MMFQASDCVLYMHACKNCTQKVVCLGDVYREFFFWQITLKSQRKGNATGCGKEENHEQWNGKI